MVITVTLILHEVYPLSHIHPPSVFITPIHPKTLTTYCAIILVGEESHWFEMDWKRVSVHSLWTDNLQLSSSPLPKSSSSSSSSSSGSRCPWQGLVGVIWLGPSRLVPSCNFRMWRTTAVALNACYRDREGERERGRKNLQCLTATEGEKTAKGYKMCSNSCQSQYCCFSRSLCDSAEALTFHLLLAKFFLICALTDSWMFLSRAVSPQILQSQQEWKNL